MVFNATCQWMHNFAAQLTPYHNSSVSRHFCCGRGKVTPTLCKVPSLKHCYGNLNSLPIVLLGNRRKLAFSTSPRNMFATGDRVLFVFGMSCSFLPTPTWVPILVTLLWQSPHVGTSHDHDQLYCSIGAEESLSFQLLLSLEACY